VTLPRLWRPIEARRTVDASIEKNLDAPKAFCESPPQT